jgi:L,D-transpeptidase catalytic domain/Putative peptidoglycan binding domain
MSAVYARGVRAVVAVGIFVAAAAPAGAGQAETALTLQAPGATTFGHVVDFAGRLTPSAPGTRVSLIRGKALVAAMAIRGDGTYRFQVEIGRPGPFHTVAAGVSSKPVAVQIVPKLRAELVGSRVVGAPLTLVTRLQPTEAGAVRVRVVRDGSYAYRGSFSGRARARVRLGTASPAPFVVAVDVLPAKGYGYVGERISVALRAPTVSYGYEGPFVSVLLARLRELGYVAPSSRNVFNSDAQQAVYAFQKAQRLERTGVADAAFWRRLARPADVVPRYPFPSSHIEIDKQRQILMVVRGGRAVLISPVSTAGIAGYYTPVGRFAIGRKVPGYDPSPLGVLYKPMYFYGGYAIHGNPSVPPYPASHGCIRVPNFVADRLYESEPYGEAVIVY